MRKAILLIITFLLLAACKDGADVRGIPGPAEVEATQPERKDLKTEMTTLEDEGFEVSIYEVEEEEYLKQKYFVAILKTDQQQEGSEIAKELQQLDFDEDNEGDYVSLAGPVSDGGEVKGIVVFNTPTLEMADSLARLLPVVQAERLDVEIYPWWVTKGEKLQ